MLEIDSRECRNRHLGTERLDQGTLGRPIGSACRRRQITVGKEGLDGGPEGRFRGVETSWGRPSGVPTRDNPQASFGSSRPNTLALPTVEGYSQEILANYLS